MLEELRKKSRATQNLYAFWGAFGITSLIASIWAVSLVIKFSETEAIPFSGAEQTAGAFSQFFDKAKSELSGVFDKEEEPETIEEGTSTSTATSTVEEKPVATSTDKKPAGRPVLVGTSTKGSE